MLEIKNLHAEVEGKAILKGVNLTINDGEVHVLMGPNGSGKSTLSNVLVGNPKYEVTEGSISFNGKDLLAMKPEDRAHEGIFMSFQAPTEIPGVSMTNFMRAAVNAKRTYFGQDPMSASATRYSKWQCSSPLSVFSTRLTLDSMWMHCASWQRALINSARRRRALWSSPTTNVCSTISSPISFTFLSTDELCVAVVPNWVTTSRRKDSNGLLKK